MKITGVDSFRILPLFRKGKMSLFFSWLGYRGYIRLPIKYIKEQIFYLRLKLTGRASFQSDVDWQKVWHTRQK